MGTPILVMRLLTIVAIAVAVSVAPVAARTTAIPGPDGRTVSIYLAQPAARRHAPAVLILHGCEGFDAHYRAIADGFARAGYAAVALADSENACKNRSGSRIEARRARAVLDWMHAQSWLDGERIALDGYSMGAIATLDLIDSEHGTPAPHGVRGAVAYYPNCARRRAADLRTPLLVLDGSADTVTPAEPCRALAAGSSAITIRTYPGATHAFDVDEPARTFRGSRLAYDPAAARDAAARTLAFLARVLDRPADHRGSVRRAE
jgi:dienelactone hydrolase